MTTTKTIAGARTQRHIPTISECKEWDAQHAVREEARHNEERDAETAGRESEVYMDEQRDRRSPRMLLPRRFLLDECLAIDGVRITDKITLRRTIVDGYAVDSVCTALTDLFQ